MTGRTHKRVSVGCAYLVCILAYCLKPFGFEIAKLCDYYVILAVCVEFCKEGTLFPDLDHAWQSVKEKTVVSRLVNVLIHIFRGKHRSRNTHSWDLAILAGAGYFAATYWLLKDSDYYMLWLTTGAGFFAGWWTHLLADMLTSDGVYICFWMKNRVSFVPKSLFGFKFNTGGEWEDFVYKMATVFEWMFCMFALVVPIVRYVMERFGT